MQEFPAMTVARKAAIWRDNWKCAGNLHSKMDGKSLQNCPRMIVVHQALHLNYQNLITHVIWRKRESLMYW